MDLYFVSRADIFAIYPKILKEILKTEDAERSEDEVPIESIRLPSDVDYKERIYYRLVEIQKAIIKLIDSGVSTEDFEEKNDYPEWDPSSQSISLSSLSPRGLQKRRQCFQDDPLGYLDSEKFNIWPLDDLIKAAKLLRNPPIPCTFFDEYEMRRVYSMIYDVFRYKHVLSQALNDVAFFIYHPELQEDKHRVWLLLYDLYLRHFLKREPAERFKQTILYAEANLEIVYKHIWKNRTHLAAAIARLRIKSCALQLSDLLPSHLQNEKVAMAAANPIVTGWLNPYILRKKSDARKCMTENGFVESMDTEDGEQPLDRSYYRWDKVCPLFVSCMPQERTYFAQSDIIKSNKLIMQDRAFTIGPSIFSELMHFFEIEGDVVQSQVSSPRSTAYLAAIIQFNNRVGKFYAFGAGSRLYEYKEVLKNLGCDNVKIFAENFCEYPLQSQIMQKVVGIFVTPINSYSAVTDPIDLICSRGGDLTMLKVLTESEMSDESKKRVADILDQQRESLKAAMSLPHVQYCLYQSHSVVSTENEVMVERSVEHVNDSAYKKHLEYYKERKRLDAIAEQEVLLNEQMEKLQSGGISAKKKSKSEEPAKKIAIETDNLSSSSESESEVVPTPRSKKSPKADEHINLKIPRNDLFEVGKIPDICSNQDNCLNFKEHGVFLSLIRRKLIRQLDEKYLISMAEKRGLFGDTESKKAKSRPQTRGSKRDEKPKILAKEKRRKTDDITHLIDRLSQPTNSWLNRTNLMKKSTFNNQLLFISPNESLICKRHISQTKFQIVPRESDHRILASRPKQWWKTATKYMKSIALLQTTNEVNRKTIFDDIKKKKIKPLCLPRIPSVHSDTPRIRFNMTLKDPYPVAMSNVEFLEYRDTNSTDLLRLPTLISDPNPKTAPNSVRRPVCRRFKPLGFASIDSCSITNLE